MKNKLLLTLGSSLLVFAPVITVVACDDDKPAEESAEQKALNTYANAIVITAPTVGTIQPTALDALITATATGTGMTIDTEAKVTQLKTDLGLTTLTIANVATSGFAITAKVTAGTAVTAGQAKNYVLTITVAKTGLTSKTKVGNFKSATPAAANPDQDAVASYATALKAAIKSSWTGAETSETVTSTKANSAMPATDSAAATLDAAKFTSLGLTVTMPANTNTVTVTGLFTKTAATETMGSTLAISITKGSATAVTLTLKIQDTDQVAQSTNMQLANTEKNKVSVTDLGAITMAGEVPTAAELKTAIKAANTTVLESTEWAIIGTASGTTADVHAKVNNVLSGGTPKTVTYTKATAQVPAGNAIITTALGTIASGASTKTAAQLDTLVSTPSTNIADLGLTGVNLSTATVASMTVSKTSTGIYSAVVVLTHTATDLNEAARTKTVTIDSSDKQALLDAEAANAAIATDVTALKTYLTGTWTGNAAPVTSTVTFTGAPDSVADAVALTDALAKAILGTTITATELPTFTSTVDYTWTKGSDATTGNVLTITVSKTNGTTVTLTVNVTLAADPAPEEPPVSGNLL